MAIVKGVIALYVVFEKMKAEILDELFYLDRWRLKAGVYFFLSTTLPC